MMSFIKLYLITFCLMVKFLHSKMVLAQNCKFQLDYNGEGDPDKCAAICKGSSFKCIADSVCLCQSCLNVDGSNVDNQENSDVHTHDQVICEFTQECTRKCMEMNSKPDYGVNIGSGKMCRFIHELYGSEHSICACTCL